MQANLWRVAAATVVLACGAHAQRPPREYSASYFELSRKDFQGVVDGKATDLFTIENQRGAFAKITNLGAKIEQVVVPDASGRFGDVVLGYPSLEAVQQGQPSMGAFLARYGGRIAGRTFVVDNVQLTGAAFELGGQTFTIPANDGKRPHTVHGGARGSRFRVFDANQVSPASVRMTLDFAAAEDAAPGFTGFPATLKVEVIYTLTDQDALEIRYRATALDAATVVNLTSHPFFNLANTPGTPIANHLLAIHADQFLELGDALIPTGNLRDVAGTPLDFRTPKRIGADIGNVGYDMLARIDPVNGGYDHTFVVGAVGKMKRVATVVEPDSGRTLDVWSTEPGLQLFTANSLTGEGPRDVGKGGVPYPSRSAVCLEPMHYPDSPNRPEFPSTTLAQGETYSGQIVYDFGTVGEEASAPAPAVVAP